MIRFSILFFYLWISQLQITVAQDQLSTQLQKGIAAFKKANYAKAERIFDKLLTTEPSYALVYIWKGKCLYQFEEYQAAYEAISTACNLEPTHAPHWLELGQFKYNIGISSIRKPELCGDCGTFLLPNRNQHSLQATDYYKSALKDYQKAIQLDANYAEAYYQLALTHEVLGDKNKACLNLKKAQDFLHNKASQYAKEICP